MRKAMVGCASSGASHGEGRSTAGISTSTVPTAYGPWYSGKELIGLRLGSHDVAIPCQWIGCVGEFLQICVVCCSGQSSRISNSKKRPSSTTSASIRRDFLWELCRASAIGMSDIGPTKIKIATSFLVGIGWSVCTERKPEV